MPRTSDKKILLQAINQLELKVAEQQLKNLQEWDQEDEFHSDDSSISQESLIITPPSPIIHLLDIESNTKSISSVDLTEARAAHHQRLLGAIQALWDEVVRVCVLNRVVEQPLLALQLHLLAHFAEFRPHLFHKKVRVDPPVFDCILNQISDNPIFNSGSNNPQLPIAIQLVIFLNRASHYGNAVTLEDMSQWAGVSIGSVMNCTNQVMLAILGQHNDFMYIPGADSAEIGLAECSWSRKHV